MAIDPRIALGVRAPDITPALNIFQNALSSAQARDINQAQEARTAAAAPLQQKIQEQVFQQNQQVIGSERNQQRLSAIHETSQRLKPFLASGDIEGAQRLLTANIQNIQSRIDAGETNLDVTESTEALAKLQSGNVEGLLNDINVIESLVVGRGVDGKSVGQRDFEAKIELVKGDPKLTTPAAKAAAIDLGLEARASTSAQERVATDPELTAAVAASQAEIEGAKAGAKEGAKLETQLNHLPAVRKAVKLAEKKATEQGEVLTDLSRMEASLPGLKVAVGELIELSDLATSTLGGRAFDFLVKESGFGSTKGANARAKLIAIVDNQVLPLLKETFGAAFTVQEGENLKASLVDPNASPAQKREQLAAFIEQKERNIRTKQTQLSAPEQTPVTDEFAGFKVIR